MLPNLKFLVLALLVTPSLFAVTLQESMRTAFEKNPRTQANDLRLKAMEQRTKAAWLAFLPRIHAGYHFNKSQTTTTTAGVADYSQSLSRQWTFGLSVNIYDGGAKLYTARASEASEKALAAQYNSTNALIPNTRGAIASLVFTAYTNILRSREQLKFYKELKSALDKIMTATTTPDESTQISSALNSLSIGVSNLEYEIQRAEQDYEYVVKEKAPADFDSFEQAIQSIEIPETAEDAIRISLEKSPELQVAMFTLEATQLNAKAEKASIYSPRIDFSLSKGLGSSAFNQDPFNQNRSTTAGLTAQWSFGAPDVVRGRATAVEVEAAEKDKDGALDELKYNLNSVYPELKNFSNLSSAFEENLELAEGNLQKLLLRIDQGEKGNIVYALSLIEDLQNNWSSAMAMKQSLLSTRFRIQKTIGTLFEKVAQ